MNKYKDLIHENIKIDLISSDNTLLTENINIVTKKGNVNVTTWAYFENKKYVLKNTLEIAKNFENAFEDKKVIAAINADYFQFDGISVNANLIYGNRVLKPDNHIKYQSIEVDSLGKKIKEHKNMQISDDIIINIDEVDYFEGKDFIEVNNIANNSYDQIVRFSEIRETSSLNHTFKELVIDDKNFTLTIKTNNPKLKEDIKNAKSIIYQNKVYKLNIGSSVFGYDTKLVSNNKVLSYEEMTGQSYANNHDRHPRSGFGYDREGNMKIITVDGRTQESSGVNLLEFAQIMNEKGFVEGYNLDGGGSTQLVLRVDEELKIINKPSEYPLRSVGNAIIFFVNK